MEIERIYIRYKAFSSFKPSVIEKQIWNLEHKSNQTEIKCAGMLTINL